MDLENKTKDEKFVVGVALVAFLGLGGLIIALVGSVVVLALKMLWQAILG
jgi:hypothetical protein